MNRWLYMPQVGLDGTSRINLISFLEFKFVLPNSLKFNISHFNRVDYKDFATANNGFVITEAVKTKSRFSLSIYSKAFN